MIYQPQFTSIFDFYFGIFCLFVEIGLIVVLLVLILIKIFKK